MSEPPALGDDRPDDAIVAGEYALGLLSEPERRAVERRIGEDAAFAALVEGWTMRLQPLADGVPESAPPAQLWSRIAAATGNARAAPSGGWWESLSLWRWATVVSSAAAVAGILTLVSLVGELKREPLVASLQASGAGAVVLARIDTVTGRLVVQPVSLPHPAATVPELWLIPGDGRPRSLGVIAAAQPSQIAIPEPLAPHMRVDATLAVSLEPAGGSPTGQPTGPVVAIGKLQRI